MTVMNFYRYMEVCMEKGGSVNGGDKKKHSARRQRMKGKVNRKNTNELLNQTGMDISPTDSSNKTTDMDKRKTEPGGS